jgi:hypothetical protein
MKLTIVMSIFALGAAARADESRHLEVGFGVVTCPLVGGPVDSTPNGEHQTTHTRCFDSKFVDIPIVYRKRLSARWELGVGGTLNWFTINDYSFSNGPVFGGWPGASFLLGVRADIVPRYLFAGLTAQVGIPILIAVPEVGATIPIDNVAIVLDVRFPIFGFLLTPGMYVEPTVALRFEL